MIKAPVKINRRRPQRPKVAVIGGGSWATALVKVLTDNNNKVYWWMRDNECIQHIKTYHHNPKYLRSVEINIRRCRPTIRLKRAVKVCDYVLLAVPAKYLPGALEKLNGRSFKNKTVISAIKGLESESHMIIGEYLRDNFDVDLNKFVVIAGPSHAEEVAQEKLSYLTIAGPDKAEAEKVEKLIKCRYINTKVTDDIYGTEYTSALKNIIAIASGICHGLGYGDNFQAVLISNAIQEIQRFVDAVHPIDRDIKGSAYLGDLLVTCYSQFSRNRTFGNMIGKGYTISSAQMEMNMVAEGYFAARSIYAINRKYNVEMPITEAVYNILYEGAIAYTEIKSLTEKLS